jgi:hypothetical protein
MGMSHVHNLKPWWFSAIIIADLREVNKVIKRKPFPLPKITNMLPKLEGFMYATSLDLNIHGKLPYVANAILQQVMYCLQSL